MGFACRIVATLIVGFLLRGGFAQQDPANASAPPPADSPQIPANMQSEPPKNPPAAKRGSKKHKRSANQSNPASEPHKVVVPSGSTPEPVTQIAPGMSEEQANARRQNAEQLLATTERNLKDLESRSLNIKEKETVSQIKNYMSGARSALKDSDPQRANTLAFKAQLLADDLVKHPGQ